MVAKGVFLLLGSNLGDSRAIINQAKLLIGMQVGKIKQNSSIYQTAAWGKTDQADFLNQVLEIETNLSPNELLEACLSIEKELGRIRIEKWGQRIIDIDILYYGEMVIDTLQLKIPHPHIASRAFTLIPLLEITDEQFLHPLLLKNHQQMLGDCEDKLSVIKL